MDKRSTLEATSVDDDQHSHLQVNKQPEENKEADMQTTPTTGKSKDFHQWTKEELSKYLEEKNIAAETVEKLKNQEIAGRHIPDLTMNILMRIGINYEKCLELQKVFNELQKLEQKAQLMKVYNDPIHGHIEVNPACQAIIDTPIFQRLRFIKQLGMVYYVYPGAQHNRFEHSLGVYHLAGQFVRNLQQNHPEKNITERDILCVEIAALCHDLGHGPFSHVFDNLFLSGCLMEKKEDLLKKIETEINDLDVKSENKERKNNTCRILDQCATDWERMDDVFQEAKEKELTKLAEKLKKRGVNKEVDLKALIDEIKRFGFMDLAKEKEMFIYEMEEGLRGLQTGTDIKRKTDFLKLMKNLEENIKKLDVVAENFQQLKADLQCKFNDVSFDEKEKNLEIKKSLLSTLTEKIGKFSDLKIAELKKSLNEKVQASNFKADGVKEGTIQDKLNDTISKLLKNATYILKTLVTKINSLNGEINKFTSESKSVDFKKNLQEIGMSILQKTFKKELFQSLKKQIENLKIEADDLQKKNDLCKEVRLGIERLEVLQEKEETKKIALIESLRTTIKNLNVETPDKKEKLLHFLREEIKYLGFLDDSKHDQISVKLIDTLNNEVQLEKKFNLDEKDIIFIKELIGGPLKITGSQAWPYQGRRKKKSFLYEIVCNKRNFNDVNVWDYLARDCHHLGFFNNFDYSRFMKFARIIDDDGELQICIRDKEIANLYNMFYTRYTLHKYAYQHKVNCGLEIMVTDVLKCANNIELFKGKSGTKLKISDCIKDMEAFVQLTDNILFKILHLNEETVDEENKPKLMKAKEIIERIFRRNLYTCVWESPPISPKMFTYKNEPVDELNEAIKKIEGIEAADFVVKRTYLDFGMKEENPVERLKVYSKRTPNVARYFTKAESSIILGPAKFNEVTLRVYSKTPDKETHNKLYDKCDEWFTKFCKKTKELQQKEEQTKKLDAVKAALNDLDLAKQIADKMRE